VFEEPPFTSIKMAKNQNLSLSPHKINGLCGKIMCCVSFENEHYSQTLREMPKMNQKVKTPDGNGFVCGHDCLRCRVNVKVPRGEGVTEIKNYGLAEVKFEKEGSHFEESES
jgi:cell fate regulator YaaT (PSP1 superfamily)